MSLKNDFAFIEICRWIYVKLYPATWERGVKKLEKFADIFLGGHLDGKNNGG